MAVVNHSLPALAAKAGDMVQYAPNGNKVMNATLERTFILDRDLARRAERKLRRYGRTLDDAFAYIINVVVSTRGEPQFVRDQENDPFFQEPNASHLRRAISDMNAGRNVVYHDIIEDAADA